MGAAAQYLIASERDWLDVAGAIAGVLLSAVTILTVIGAVVRWVTKHAITDAVSKGMDPVLTKMSTLSDMTVKLDARLTAHLDSEDATNEAWARDWAAFRQEHTQDVRELHTRIDEVLSHS